MAPEGVDYTFAPKEVFTDTNSLLAGGLYLPGLPVGINRVNSPHPCADSCWTLRLRVIAAARELTDDYMQVHPESAGTSLYQTYNVRYRREDVEHP